MTLLTMLFDPRGHSNRKQFALMLLGLVLVASLVGFFFGFFMETIPAGTVAARLLGFPLLGLFIIALALWFIAHIRRLHDRGHSGWLALVCIIPLVGYVLTFYLLFAPGIKSQTQE